MPDSHADKRLQGFLRPLTREVCEEQLEKIDSTNLSTGSDQGHVNVGARGSVPADTFFARGAAAVTLIEALERAGMRVQVDMLSLATNGQGREVRIACRLKEAGEVLQLDKLAFCLAHPALHRKLNFSLRLKHAGWVGGSIDVPVDQRGDIYIDAADPSATQVWLDPVKAQEWVLAQLKAQGIVMRAA